MDRGNKHIIALPRKPYTSRWLIDGFIFRSPRVGNNNCLGSVFYCNDARFKDIARMRFDRLDPQLRPAVFRSTFRVTRDGSPAVDVVQETFMRAWRTVDSLADQKPHRILAAAESSQ